jgi:hypothetical protein
MQSLSAAQGFAPPPPLFPPADPIQFHTLVSIKILVLHDIYSSGLTNAISSLCRDNLRHQTTLMDRPAHRRTNPDTHLTDVLLNLVVRHDYGIYWMFVYSFMWVLVSVVNYFVILVMLWSLWRNMWSLWAMSCVLCMWCFCELCDVYVMIIWYIFYLFGWNSKNK